MTLFQYAQVSIPGFDFPQGDLGQDLVRKLVRWIRDTVEKPRLRRRRESAHIMNDVRHSLSAQFNPLQCYCIGIRLPLL